MTFCLHNFSELSRATLAGGTDWLYYFRLAALAWFGEGGILFLFLRRVKTNHSEINHNQTLSTF